jgi:hypothetical protein
VASRTTLREIMPIGSRNEEEGSGKARHFEVMPVFLTRPGGD